MADLMFGNAFHLLHRMMLQPIYYHARGAFASIFCKKPSKMRFALTGNPRVVILDVAILIKWEGFAR
jgi:hypothetical protein